MTIGERIRQVRQQRGLTMAELGAKVGLTAAAISRYELGQRKLSFGAITQIADALEVPLRSILPPDELSGDFFSFDALFDTLDDNLFRVRQAYQLLNPQGQEEAAKRIEELTEIPKYRESPSDKK